MSSESGHWFRTQVLLIGYSMVVWIGGLKSIRLFLWDTLKLELFYIGGHCKSSGHCCKGLNIVVGGDRIETIRQFEAACVSNPSYSRFLPQINHGTISHFECRCLSSENRCGDYLGRPKICRDYPHSMFIHHGYIFAGCGYTVLPKRFSRRHWIPRNIRHSLDVIRSINSRA